MWNKVSFIYLIVCAVTFTLLSIFPRDGIVLVQPVLLIASLTYPFTLIWMKSKTGFWKGFLQLLLILSFALICGFIAGLLSNAYYQYQRLGNEFHLLEALGWNFGESLIWFIALEVIPAAIIAVVCYPIGHLASRLLVRKLPKVEEH
jgi:hypothetical protein